MIPRHDLDPDAMTEGERLAKRRYDAYFVFETAPSFRHPELGVVVGYRNLDEFDAACDAWNNAHDYIDEGEDDAAQADPN